MREPQQDAFDFFAVVYLKSREYLLDVIARGVEGERKRASDFLIALSLGQQQRDLSLLRGKLRRSSAACQRERARLEAADEEANVVGTTRLRIGQTISANTESSPCRFVFRVEVIDRGPVGPCEMAANFAEVFSDDAGLFAGALGRNGLHRQQADQSRPIR